MKLDEILPLLGNFGWYQLVVICLCCLHNLFFCFTTLGNVFYAAEIDHWCNVLPKQNCSSWPELVDNCTAVKRSVLLPPAENPESQFAYSNCKQWDLPDGYVFDPYVPLDGFNYSAVPCKDGWMYDTSQYKTTTISDVSPNLSIQGVDFTLFRITRELFSLLSCF